MAEQADQRDGETSPARVAIASEAERDCASPSSEEFWQAESAAAGESESLVRKLARAAETLSARAVRGIIFGPSQKAIELAGIASLPAAFLSEGDGKGPGLAAAEFTLRREATLQPVILEGRRIGFLYEDHSGRHCVLNGVGPAHPEASPEQQTEEVFLRMEQALKSAGMDFSAVYRTWFFLDHILDWYDRFNEVRNRFFQSRGIYERLVPASTGVGVGNAAGWALAGSLLAARFRSPAQVTAVGSPLQCPALEYGSSFSRAVKIESPGWRRLVVSGTASIAQDGRTLRAGETRGQIEHTLEVVHAILQAQEMDWDCAVRGIAYLKHSTDLPVWKETRKERGLERAPFITVKSDICRDDLLFELELDAARPI